ncbi:MAG: hypothetical protein AVDCRST_MAG49-2480 [uncultured Thermomicrobiales bacterium]|uniref:Uncharacterized protein n=1 Tax=uncultured Thermomicrobiales bacterium TaxID=1645740 RepID=A0A6J4UW22_9BACT|nr:MAG: hypothetical protein AVDCRST_MAG49-2480 [uncultured Thermomicrobiales bacterium]
MSWQAPTARRQRSIPGGRWCDPRRARREDKLHQGFGA